MPGPPLAAWTGRPRRPAETGRPTSVCRRARGREERMTTPVIVFDVNETLSDLSRWPPASWRSARRPAPPSLWFASVLRDGFALSSPVPGRASLELARETLADPALRSSRSTGPSRTPSATCSTGLPELPVAPRRRPRRRALADAGFRLVTLSNGTTAGSPSDSWATPGMPRPLRAGAVRGRRAGVEAVAPRPTRTPPQQCDVTSPRRWCWSLPTRGTSTAPLRAGLGAVWVDRHEGHYPRTLQPADAHRSSGIDGLSTSSPETRARISRVRPW